MADDPRTPDDPDRIGRSVEDEAVGNADEDFEDIDDLDDEEDTDMPAGAD